MPGIVLKIEIDDNGTVKVKQFSDETKKAFDEIKNGPKAAQGPLDKLRDSWVGLATKVGVVTAAVYAAKRAFYDTGKELASAANDIERQAKVLAISTDEFQKWQYAAKMSDVNAQELAIGMKYLSKDMEDASSGTGEAAKYFSAMGIAVKTADGHLRPLNDVMQETMDKFAAWEDGPRKIAIALQLFGRSGETLIPLLNQGRAGFEEFSREAERLGIILSPDLVRKGSEAEDTFKKIDAQITAIKLNCAPLGYEFSKLLFSMSDGLRKIREEAERDPIRNWINTKLPEYARSVAEFTGITKSITKEWPFETRFRLPVSKGTPPPVIEDKDQTEKMRQALEETKRLIENFGWQPYLEGLDRASPLERELTRLTLENQDALKWLSREAGDYAQMMADDMFPSLDKVNQMIEKGNIHWNENQKEINAIKNLIADFGWEDFASGAVDAANDATRELSKMRLEFENAARAAQAGAREIEHVATGGEIFAQRMGEAWNFNIRNMIRDTKNFGDAAKNVFAGVGDAFSSAVSRMISDYIAYGNVIGKYESGRGVVGWIGKNLGLEGLIGGGDLAGGVAGIIATAGGMGAGGALPHFAQGGDFWVNRPTPIMVGEGGRREHVQITPEGQARGGQTIINITNNIMTNDVDSFRRYLLANRDLLEGISLNAFSEAKRYSKTVLR